jgi:Spy/CpxP family protein refolding chaperone
VKWHLIIPVSLAALVVVGGAALAAACHAQAGGWKRDPALIERRMAKHLDRVLDELDATDAQRAQGREILKRYAPQLKALRENHEATRDELEALWASESLDATALRGVVDRKLDEARAAGYKLADAFSEIHALLTPEQRSQLADLHEERRERRWGCR